MFMYSLRFWLGKCCRRLRL